MPDQAEMRKSHENRIWKQMKKAGIVTVLAGAMLGGTIEPKLTLGADFCRDRHRLSIRVCSERHRIRTGGAWDPDSRPE